MEEDLIKIWIPIEKSSTGGYKAIITDTSIDRQDELMSEAVIDKVVNKNSLVSLADHKNTMENWVGGFQNIEKINKKGHFAAVAEPWFFSKQANPMAARIEKQLEEATNRGTNPGISIGARALKSESVKIDGKSYKMHTDIEPLEATWTPIGANRNSFAYVAKSLNLEEIEKGCSEKMKRCIEHVKSQGKSEESAAKICNTQIKDSYVYDLMDNKIMEVIKMIEDLEKKEEIKEKSESLDSTPDIEKQKEKDEAEEEKKKDKKKKEEEEKKKSLTEEDVKKILD